MKSTSYNPSKTALTPGRPIKPPAYHRNPIRAGRMTRSRTRIRPVPTVRPTALLARRLIPPISPHTKHLRICRINTRVPIHLILPKRKHHNLQRVLHGRQITRISRVVERQAIRAGLELLVLYLDGVGRQRAECGIALRDLGQVIWESGTVVLRVGVGEVSRDG